MKHAPGGSCGSSENFTIKQDGELENSVLPAWSMGSLGLELKSERERQEITLSQIAASTHISLRHLQYLEEGLYKQLPGGMYNRAFLKAYCEYLKLDPQEMLKRYDAETSTLHEKPHKPTPEFAQSNSGFKLHPLGIWVMMLLISAVGLFLSRNWISNVFSPYFSSKPPSNTQYGATVQPTESSPIESETITTTANPLVFDLNNSGESMPITARTGQSVLDQDNPDAGIATPAITEVNQEKPLSASPLRLEFEAFQACWISIKSDDQRAVEKILEPGDEQSFNATEQFDIHLGNAGGVNVKINGEPTKPLGKPGEVFRMQLTKQNISDLIEKTAG